jgi:putative transposase
MNRGRRGESVFSGKQDFETFITLLQEAAELWNVRVSAYCLMSNHYHLLLQTPNGNLTRFMRHLNGVYTQRYNRLHGYDGQLFRGRYKAILVEEDSYLLELVRYIHRNPLRAGIVATLDKYPWSSHQGYLSAAKTWDWLHKDFVLSMLSGKRKTKKAYEQFMAIEDSQKILGVLEKKKWPSMLGSDDFIAWVKEKFFASKKHRQVPESFQLAPERALIIREVCRNYGVSEQELLAAKRGKKNEPRNVAIYLCRQMRNETLIDLGEAFGMTGYSPAGSAMDRIKKKLPSDRRLQKRLQQITKAVFNQNKCQSET